MDSEDQSALNVLVKEKEALLSEVELLNRLIDRIKLRSGSSVMPSTTVGTTTPDSGSVNSNEASQPTVKLNLTVARTSPEERIKYVFNTIKQVGRYPELKKAFEELKLPSGNLRHDLSEVRLKGNVVAIKYNRNAVFVLLGLKEWVVEAEYGPTFKDEYLKPVLNLFPNGIYHSDWARLTQETENQKGHSQE